MSIGSMMANLFGGGQPQQPQQQQMPQPGNLPAQQTPAMQSSPANPNVPAGQTDPAPANPATNAQPEGLDRFNDLWKPVESPAGGAPDPLFNVDPKQLMEAAKKIDFTKVIQPTQLQAIAQGGEQAVSAFAQALNTVAQTVYAQNAHATAKIVEQAVAKSQEAIRSELPQHIKRQTVSDSLRTDNPALSHPAAAPILGALEQQLTMKFPNATAPEIKAMATDYLTSFAGTFQKPASQQTQSAQTNQGMDWDSWIK